jgi:hypothetical protein
VVALADVVVELLEPVQREVEMHLLALESRKSSRIHTQQE